MDGHPAAAREILWVDVRGIVIRVEVPFDRFLIPIWHTPNKIIRVIQAQNCRTPSVILNGALAK